MPPSHRRGIIVPARHAVPALAAIPPTAAFQLAGTPGLVTAGIVTVLATVGICETLARRIP